MKNTNVNSDKSGEVTPTPSEESTLEHQVSLVNQLIGSFNSCRDLYFVVRESDLDMAIRDNYYRKAELLLKKAVLYANRTILLREPTRHFTGYGRTPYLVNTWGDGEIFKKMEKISGDLKYNEMFYDIFTILPEKIIHEWEFSDNDEDTVQDEQFDFSSSHNNRFGIDLSLSDPTLNAHIFERLDTHPQGLSVLNIWLPQLANVPLDVLLKIRQDEGDSFQRFQYAIQKLIANSEDLESETVLKELFQYVDYEVRTFQAKMVAIKKSRALAVYEAVLGFSIMGLCFAAPTDIAKVLVGIAGASPFKDFIGSLIKKRSQAYDLKTSDFYVPWLCTTKSKG